MSNKKILAAVLIFFCSALYAQDNSTYNFLRLDVDARSSAIAGSSVTATNDANGIFYNPSSLATLKNKQGSVGFFKYLLDINSGSAAFSQKYKDIGYFGVGLRFMNYGEFDKYDENYNNIGTFGANDIAFSVGYANKYKDNLNYGISLKLIYSNIDTYTSTAIASDLGILYTIPSQELNIGISLLNIGSQLKSFSGTRENLPLDLRIGFSKKLEYLPLTFFLSFTNLTQTTEKFYQRFKNLKIGGEIYLSDNVVLRAGYNNQQRQDLKTGNSLGIGGFSAGLGIRIEEKIMVDYAFNSFGKIGATHRFNIGYNFLK